MVKGKKKMMKGSKKHSEWEVMKNSERKQEGL